MTVDLLTDGHPIPPSRVKSSELGVSNLTFVWFFCQWGRGIKSLTLPLFFSLSSYENLCTQHLRYLVTSSDVQLGKSAHIVNALLKARWWCYDTIHQVISIFGENPSWQSLFSDKRSVECTVQSRFSDTKFSGNLLFSRYFCIVEITVLMTWREEGGTPFWNLRNDNPV